MSVLMVLLVACQNNNDAKKEIESQVNALYSQQESIYNFSSEKDLFSKALTQKIENLKKLTKDDTERIKNSDSPSDKPMMLEGNAFTSLSDGFQKYTIKDVKITDKTAEATVEFEYNHSNPKVTWTDKVVLVNENGWKIDEVEFDTKQSKDKNLSSRLASVNSNGGGDAVLSGDTVLKDIDGNELKLSHGKENATATVTFTFKGETAVLKQVLSGSGIRYADEKEHFVLFVKGGNEVTLLKDDKVVFSTPEKFLEYTEAKNYFVKNDYPDKEMHSAKLTSEAELSKIFGAAATMGKEGVPTKIDFSKYYAIALIGKTNNEGNDIAVGSVIKLNNTVTVTLSVNPKEEGKKQSYTSRPFKILVVDKKYQGDIKVDAF